MNARRLLTFLAAALITAGQTLVFAVDTSARAQSTSPTVAAHEQPALQSVDAGRRPAAATSAAARKSASLS